MGQYELSCSHSGPVQNEWLVQQARLVESHTDPAGGLDQCSLAVSHVERGVLLSVLLDYDSRVWKPGALLLPDEARLFLGAGGSILCYDLQTPRRLWKEPVEYGFGCWIPHAEGVLLQAELELAGFDRLGNKLWSSFLDPPADVAVIDGLVRVESDFLLPNMKTPFSALRGPPAP